MSAVAEAIEQDLPCIGCEYNLRGLAPADRCPECGGSIRDSLQVDVRLARQVPPLRSLASGILVIVLAVLAVSVPYVINVTSPETFKRVGNFWMWTVPILVSQVLAAAGWFVAAGGFGAEVAIPRRWGAAMQTALRVAAVLYLVSFAQDLFLNRPQAVHDFMLLLISGLALVANLLLYLLIWRVTALLRTGLRRIGRLFVVAVLLVELYAFVLPLVVSRGFMTQGPMAGSSAWTWIALTVYYFGWIDPAISMSTEERIMLVSGVVLIAWLAMLIVLPLLIRGAIRRRSSSPAG